MVRPLVLLFQEFAEQTATAQTPDLNTILVGPAYHIYDYPDDREAIEVSKYGTLNQPEPYQAPIANTPVTILAGMPGAPPGSWLVPDSVRVYFEEPRVVIARGTDGRTPVVAPYENSLYSPSGKFVTDGVQVGDSVIFTYGDQELLLGNNPEGPTGLPTSTLTTTVTAVESETVIRVSSNFALRRMGSDFRIERRLPVQEIPASYVKKPEFMASNEVQIYGGVKLVVGSAEKEVSYARVFVAYRSLRTDLQTVNAALKTADITTNIGRIDARNPLAAAVHVARQNAGRAPIYYYGVASDDLIGFEKARDALSVDETLYAIVPITSNLNVVAAYKTENEQLADPSQALNNGIPQKFRVVIGSGTLTDKSTVVPNNEDGSVDPSEQMPEAVPPGIKTVEIMGLQAVTRGLRPGDKLTLSASGNEMPLDGTYTIAHINDEDVIEVDEEFPVTVGAPEGINYAIFRPSTGEQIVELVDVRAANTRDGVKFTSRVAGSAGQARVVAFEQSTDTAGGIHSVTEIAGDRTTIRADFDSGSITAGQIANAIRGVGVTQAFQGSVNFVADASENPSQAFNGGADLSMVAVTDGDGNFLIRTDVLDPVFIRFYDANATFLSSGVLPGDTLEIPGNLTGVYNGGTKRYTIDLVMSEQRLQIKNAVAGVYQSNSSSKETELPHYDNRRGSGGYAPGTPSLHYRIVRTLTKDQQLQSLVSVAQSFNSRRAILTWPDRVLVAGLVDGSKPKNADGTLAAASWQPGYYLSAALGGMTAGLPSQQGFTRLGIAGISKIEHSNDYFSEKQLTDLSDGGWYVFAQNSPASLPYSIHQLTTDPSTLESGEFSIVKNFDFVSLFFLGVLEPFLGVWNINNDTLGFVRQAMNTGIEQLKLRRVAKIGAPINKAALTSVGVSSASSDRIEVFVEVELPKPLNVIGLHLVA